MKIIIYLFLHCLLPTGVLQDTQLGPVLRVLAGGDRGVFGGSAWPAAPESVKSVSAELTRWSQLPVKLLGHCGAVRPAVSQSLVWAICQNKFPSEIIILNPSSAAQQGEMSELIDYWNNNTDNDARAQLAAVMPSFAYSYHHHCYGGTTLIIWKLEMWFMMEVYFESFPKSFCLFWMEDTFS